MPSSTPSQPDGKVLSLDPGITTGWAIWSDDGKLLHWGQHTIVPMLEMLARPQFSVVVYEDYRLRYGRQAPADSHHVASQLIGAVRLLEAQTKIDSQWPQEVEVLTIESLHLGLERPKKHNTGHYIDAVLHGAYFFRRVGIEPDVSRLAAGSSV